MTIFVINIKTFLKNTFKFQSYKEISPSVRQAPVICDQLLYFKFST